MSSDSGAAHGIGPQEQPPKGQNAGEKVTSDAEAKKAQEAEAAQAQQTVNMTTNLGAVMYEVMSSLSGLYFTMTSYAPQVLVVQMNQQSELLSKIASMSMGACAGSMSFYNTEESQVETDISATQQQAQALWSSGQQMNSMMVSLNSTMVQILQVSGKGPTQ